MMLKIDSFLQYEDGPVQTGVMYVCSDTPFHLEGRVDLSIFGSVFIGSVRVTDTRLVTKLPRATPVVIEEYSGVVINTLQRPVVHPKSVGVAPIPDMEDAAVRQMEAYFEVWAAKRGLTGSEGLFSEDVLRLAGRQAQNSPDDDNGSENFNFHDDDDLEPDTPLADPFFPDEPEYQNSVAESESLSDLAQVTPPEKSVAYSTSPADNKNDEKIDERVENDQDSQVQTTIQSAESQ